MFSWKLLFFYLIIAGAITVLSILYCLKRDLSFQIESTNRFSVSISDWEKNKARNEASSSALSTIANCRDYINELKTLSVGIYRNLHICFFITFAILFLVIFNRMLGLRGTPKMPPGLMGTNQDGVSESTNQSEK